MKLQPNKKYILTFRSFTQKGEQTIDGKYLRLSDMPGFVLIETPDGETHTVSTHNITDAREV